MAEELLKQFLISRNIKDLAVLFIAIDIDKYGSMTTFVLSNHICKWENNMREAIGSPVKNFLKTYPKVFKININCCVSLNYSMMIAEKSQWVLIIHLCSLLHQCNILSVQQIKNVIKDLPALSILKPIGKYLELFLNSHANVFCFDSITQLVSIAWINQTICKAKSWQLIYDSHITNFLTTRDPEFLTVLFLCAKLTLLGSLSLSALNHILGEAPKLVRQYMNTSAKGSLLMLVRNHMDVFYISVNDSITFITSTCYESEFLHCFHQMIFITHIISIITENESVSLEKLVVLITHSPDHVQFACNSSGLTHLNNLNLGAFLMRCGIFRKTSNNKICLHSNYNTANVYVIRLGSLDSGKMKLNVLDFDNFESDSGISFKQILPTPSGSISVREIDKIKNGDYLESNSALLANKKNTICLNSLPPATIDNITMLCHEVLTVEYLLVLLERHKNSLKLSHLLCLVANAPTIVKNILKETAADLAKFFIRFPTNFIYMDTEEKVASISAENWLFSSKESHALRYLASLLHYRGPLKMLNIIGHLVNSSKVTRVCIGSNKADVKKFIQLHESYFSCNKDLVQVNNNTLWQVFVGFCTPSMFLLSKRNSINVRGKIVHLHNQVGKISVDNRPNVVANFYMRDCCLEVACSERNKLNLKEFMSIGESVLFDIVEVFSNDTMQYQAVRLRKECSSVRLPIFMRDVSFHSNMQSNSVCLTHGKSLFKTERANCYESKHFCNNNSVNLQQMSLVNARGRIIFIFGMTGRIAINSKLNETAFFHIKNCTFNERDDVGTSADFFALFDLVIFDLILKTDKADKYEAIRVRHMFKNNTDFRCKKTNASSTAASTPQNKLIILANILTGSYGSEQLVSCCKEMLCYEHLSSILHKHDRVLSVTKLLQLLSMIPIALSPLNSLIKSSTDNFRWFLMLHDSYFKYYVDRDEVESYEYILKDWSSAKFLIYVIKVVASLIFIYGIQSPVRIAEQMRGFSKPVLDWIGGTFEFDVLYFLKMHSDYFYLNADSTVLVNEDNLKKLFDCKAEKVAEERMTKMSTGIVSGLTLVRNTHSKTCIRKKHYKKIKDKTCQESVDIEKSEHMALKKFITNESIKQEICHSNCLHLRQEQSQNDLKNNKPCLKKRIKMNVVGEFESNENAKVDKYNNLAPKDLCKGFEEIIDILKVIVMNTNNKSLENIFRKMSTVKLLANQIGNSKAELLKFINNHSGHFHYCEIRNIVLLTNVALRDPERRKSYAIGFLKAFLKRCGKIGYKEIVCRTKVASRSLQQDIGTNRISIENFICKNSHIFKVHSGSICSIEQSMVSNKNPKRLCDNLQVIFTNITKRESFNSLTKSSSETAEQSSRTKPSSYGHSNNTILTDPSEGLEEIIDMLKVIVINGNNKSLGDILTKMSTNNFLISKIGNTEADLVKFVKNHPDHFYYCSIRNTVLSVDVMAYNPQ